MAIRKDTGVRRVELEYEVPGTPDEVWRAIATGPGITSWFAPTEVEERPGGRVAFHLAPQMDSSGTVTAWDAPRRFAYEERDWAEGAPPLGTEFIVATRGGGTCVVRIVHTLFTDAGDWDDQLESFESGWAICFDVLRLVMQHFNGRPCSALRLMAPAAPPEPAEAWRALATGLGLHDATPGARVDTSGTSAPPLAGVVQKVRSGAQHDSVVLLDAPTTGVATFGVYRWGDHLMTAASLHFFGDAAAAIAKRDEDAWVAWIRDPSAAEANAAARG